MALSSIKQAIKKEDGMTMISIKRAVLWPPKQVANVFDLGYLGIEKDFPDQLSSLPYRKKRNQGGLSKEEKDYNKSHSKRRIVIEHAICRLKKYWILADVFRNRLRKYNKVSDIVSGLINYRIMNQ